MIKEFLFGFFILLASAPSFSQAQLVKDINTGASQIVDSDDYTLIFRQSNNLVYFSARTSKGCELWRTDGTSAGTHIVKDLNVGGNDGTTKYPSMIDFHNKLFFSGITETTGSELWVTDGTDAGTTLVKDIAPGSKSSGAGRFFLFKDKLYFVADDGIHGSELWRTDGTSAGTELVMDLSPGPDYTLYSLSSSVGSDVFYFFTFKVVGASFTSWQLWKSDGTVAGTASVKSFSSAQGDVAVVNNVAYFTGSDDGTPAKMWRSDGSTAGTFPIESIGGSSYIPYNGKILYSDGFFKITDGTVGSSQFLFNTYMSGGTVYNGIFYGLGSSNLIKTDGTLAGTQVIAELGIVQHGIELAIINDKIILPYNSSPTDPSTQELGIFDLQTQTVSMLKDINVGPSGSKPKSFFKFNDKVLFLANDGIHGIKIWITDGTANGTRLLLDTQPGTADSNPSNLFVFKDEIFFMARNGDKNFPDDLWKTVGDASTTVLCEDFEFGGLIGVLGDKFYFFDQRKIFKLNGVPGEKEIVLDMSNQLDGYGLSNSAVSNNKLFYLFGTYGALLNYGMELWVTDGSSAGTHIVKDINSGPDDGALSVGANLNSSLVFSANDGNSGYELWKSDGTETGTQMIKDINIGSGNSTIEGLTTSGGFAFFSATDGVSGKELWKTDGTTAGTVLVKDINPGSNDSSPNIFVTMGSNVYFVASDETHSLSLWKSDGTSGGTTMVKSFANGVYNIGPYPNLIAVDGKLFLSADDGLNGRELWVSDGTTNGTTIIDIVPGSEPSNPSKFFTANNICVFEADGKLWKTEGTKETTVPISDKISSYIFSNSAFASLGSWIYFGANSDEYGQELFKVNVRKYQGISFSPITSKTSGDLPFKLTATATSGLPVLFSTTSGNVSIMGDEVTILNAGRIKITANQTGNADFDTALKQDQEFCVNPSKPTIALSLEDPSHPTLTASSDNDSQWFRDDVAIGIGKKISITTSGSYKVKAIAEGCESAFSEAQPVLVITGLEQAGSIRIYPVPSSNTINLSLPEYSGQALISIYGMQGNSLIEFKTTEREKSIDISTLTSGLYIMKVGFGDKVEITKIIKQ